MRRTKQNDGSRRYPKDKHPVYHQTYNRLAKDSVILNDHERARDALNANALYGLSECRSTLLELTGNPQKDGYYIHRGDDWRLGLIPAAKQQLKEVLGRFKRWQTDQVSSGLALKPPKLWPEDLLNERLRAEAVLDMRYLEKAKVKARIQELTARQNREHRQQVLPHGPLGRISGGTRQASRFIPITSADGQRVSYTSEGIPFIDEPDSPYHGMPIAIYRAMSKQWQRDMGLTLDQLRERRDEIYLQERKEAVKAGKEPPTKKLPVTHGKVPAWMKRLGITKADWPEWPEGAKPVTELEEAVEEGS